MNTIGIFAGRGDVLVAMLLAYFVGVYSGWCFRKLTEWFRNKFSKKDSK
jgi:hypothetical protein